MCDMAHFAGLVAAGLHPNPVPHCDFVTSTTHKTLAGPARRLHPLQGGARAGGRPRRLPGHAGRAARAHDRGEGACFKIAVTEAFRDYQRGARECRRARRDADQSGGLDVLTGGTDTHLLQLDLRATGVDGQGRRGAAGTRCADGEPQHRSVRRASADGRLGRAHRHAGGDDARLRRGGLPRGRPLIVEALGGRADLAALTRAQRRALHEAAALPGLPRLHDVQT